MSHSIEVTIFGETREIKMSFGLINELAGIVGSIELVHLIGLDAEMTHGLIRSTLAKRDTNGRIIEEPPLFEIDADDPAIQAILEWVGGHITDFFLNSLEKSKIVLESRQDRLKALLHT